MQPADDRLLLMEARTPMPLPEPSETAERVRQLQVEITHLREVHEQRRHQIELEGKRADAERQRADDERQRADQLLAELEELRRRMVQPSDADKT